MPLPSTADANSGSGLQRLILGVLGLALFQLAFGAFTRGSGSGFGCRDRWPLCDGGALGGWLPRLEPAMLIEWSHRWIALLGAAGVGALALLGILTHRRPLVERRLVVATLALHVLNVGLGAVQVVIEVSSTVAIVAHLTVGAAAWVTLVTAWSHARSTVALPRTIAAKTQEASV